MTDSRVKFKARKGAILIMAAFAMMTLIIMLAFVIDIGRGYVERSELQVGADAGAHAAAVQLGTDPTHSAKVVSAAVQFADSNYVLNHMVNLPTASVACGTWDSASRLFAVAACGTAADAVRVTRATGEAPLFANVLNHTPGTVTTTAVAWLAPVASSACIRPWAIPYAELTQRLDPTNPDPNRDLTAHDIALLSTLPPSALQFNLTISNPGLPGNFATVDVSGVSGLPQYMHDIAGCSLVRLGPGSVIQSEGSVPANMVSPTVTAAASLCMPLDPTSGACGDGRGGTGILVKAPLWIPTGKLTGGASVDVKIIGAFILDAVASDGSLSGHFVRAIDPGGSIGTAPSPLFRVVLAQ